MLEIALKGLADGFIALATHPGNLAMVLAGGLLVYLAIRHRVEPLLLIPIGFGAILVNLPNTDLMAPGGLLRTIYNFGIEKELFPCLIFVGIGAMADFTPLLANPKILFLGAAGQFGIFLTVILALVIGFNKLESCAIGIIGACDGPTAIYVSSKYLTDEALVGAIAVAAYSYMSLVPLIQPPIMRALTTQKERIINMGTLKSSVPAPVRIIFPIVVTIFTCILAPKGAPIIGLLMLGNFLRESGVAARLSQSAQNELINIVTLLLGICIGGTMAADKFLKFQTLIVFGLGLVAIILDTVCGLLLGKLMCRLSGGRINPLIGAAGISAFPIAARVVQKEGQKAHPQNFLLMHGLNVNAAGQIGSVIAAAVMLQVLSQMGIG